MPLCTDKSPGYSTITDTLPFNVQFNKNTSVSDSQVVCNTNMCLLPNGPVIPTRPIFPSALPPTFRPSTTNIDTNFLNVKKVGCINNLRATNLVVNNSGNNGSTRVQFVNLPSINSEQAKPLMISPDGTLSIGNMVSNTTSKNIYSKHQMLPQRMPPQRMPPQKYMRNTNPKTYDNEDSLSYHEGHY